MTDDSQPTEWVNHETDYSAMVWKRTRMSTYGRVYLRPDAELMPMWSRERESNAALNDRLSNQQWHE